MIWWVFPSCGYAKIVQGWLELFILRKVVSSVRKTCTVLYGEERPGDGIDSGDCIEQKQDMAIGRRFHETARFVLEPSVIYEAKDGKYGEDGSEAV